MLSRRALLAGGAALALARNAGAAPATVLTAADVHVDGYPTVMAVRRIGEIL
ncbi:MAG: TRAP transporter substrate-binding protein, partial [Xanthomonadales bacterium]|nr:TRAP transporter substrate-binding protein [Xanthomonadales bacterium]